MSFKSRSARFLPGLAALLIGVGLVCALGAGQAMAAIIATETKIPTPVTPSKTPTATLSPTITPTVTRTSDRARNTAGPTFTPSLTPGPGNYVVQPGDYLYKIARLLDVTVKGLRELNHLSSDTIYVGQVLALPSVVPAKAKTSTPTLLAGGQYYLVQSGDQLGAIARRYGVTTSRLRTANNLKSDLLVEGQVLVIPTPDPTRTPYPPERTYIVQPGDQLGFIAKQYGVSIQQIKTANGLTSNTIMVGQVLYIPLPATPAPPATARPTATAVPAGAVVYTVKQGDRLSIIALWYGVTTTSIKTANKLSSDTVYIGQTLTILSPTLNPVAYVVQRGDTLAGLAQRFGTTIETIRLANRMGQDQDKILVGLILMIPAAK